MQFKQTTILGLFDSSQKHFIIPVYQRAYSWDKDNLNSFLMDLKDQMDGENGYFYGNILLETIRKDVEYEVIDGQQRLTTIIIFMSVLLGVLEQKKLNGYNDIDIQQKRTIFLKNGGNIKLRVVDYDRACFETIIIDGNEKFTITSPSQQRILNAKKYFTEELSKLNDQSLSKILNRLETTEITSVELSSRVDSALMFELQNNRGKDLTNMEKLKSFFMYQMYIRSSVEETSTNVEYVSNIFKSIYISINDIKSLDEDSILIYHCQAFLKGFPYRTIDEIKVEYLKQENDKIAWIKNFVKELCTSFDNINKLENSHSISLQDLRALAMPRFVYPFILKGYKFFDDDQNRLNKLYHLLEIVAFRARLVSSRADLLSRLNEVLVHFEGNLELLKLHFTNKLEDSWYWSDFRMKEVLYGWMYGNPALHYILTKYENFIQNKGYQINGVHIESINIEHISPQTPPNDESIAHGYQTDNENMYDDEFRNDYLNCIGNLLMISENHNKSIGNKPFEEKLNSYNSNPLFNQQAEIKKFVVDEALPLWDKQAIDNRHAAIVENFALKKWTFDNVILN